MTLICDMREKTLTGFTHLERMVELLSSTTQIREYVTLICDMREKTPTGFTNSERMVKLLSSTTQIRKTQYKPSAQTKVVNTSGSGSLKNNQYLNKKTVSLHVSCK